MSLEKYILNSDKIPVKELNLMKWAQWFETADRTVSKTWILDCEVSTVFLGIDHNFGCDSHEPILWETMIFEGINEGYCRRCSGTIEDARKMHEETVERVKTGIIL